MHGSSRRGWGGLALALALLLEASSAIAQPPPAQAPPAAQPPPVLVPPQIELRPDVMYPEGAEGDATIVLTITVAADGSVKSVEEATGPEPFASAAKEGVRAFRFKPATRDGKPVPAKIRLEVSFHHPEPAPPEPPSSPSSPNPSGSSPTPSPSSPPPPKPATPAPIEVRVIGEKPPPSVSTMTRAEVRQLPGAFGDPFRAIEVLPGVTPIISGLPYFYVRGAPPGNVGYYLDGIRIPYLFHVAAGPSIVNPGLVDRVDLYSGGYPAKYGRFAGAIVSAETTPPRDDLHGEATIRAYDAGAVVESGFANGRGTVLLGGRYSYTAALFSIFSPTVKLDYRDYQARVTYDLTPRDRIGLFAFGAYDLLSQIQNGVDQVAFGAEFYRVDLRYEHKLADGGLLKWAATWGFDQSRAGEQRNAQDILYGTRVDITQPMGSSVTLHAGADATFDNYLSTPARYADPEDPSLIAYDHLFPPRADSALAAHVDMAWRIDPRFEVTPGVRFDFFRSGTGTALAVDPRLMVEADIGKNVRLLHAIGVAHQAPSFIVPVPGLQIANLEGGLQTALQASSGIEIDIPKVAIATFTAFDDVFLNMTDTLSVIGSADNIADVVKRSQGNGVGLEVYIRRRLTQHLGGFISYTLSRSSRRVHCASLIPAVQAVPALEAKFGDLGVCNIPSAFDRTHVLNTAVAYDLGRGWRAGLRFTVYTGVPAILSRTARPTGNELLDPPRDPAFYRFDFRLEKRWTLDKNKWVSFVVEMLNATFHKETINGQEIGPVAIPSLGVEGGI